MWLGMAVIAIVVVVLLAAVFGGLFGAPPRETPVVELAAPWAVSPAVFVNVSTVDGPFPLSQFAAALVVDGTEVAELDPLADNATDGTFGFRDVDADGDLSPSDVFATAPGSVGNHTLRLFFDDTEIASATWLEIPSIALGVPVVGADVRVDVAGAEDVRPLSEYAATLTRNGTAIGTLSPLAAGSDGNLSFTDLSGDGNLTGGDRFVVNRTDMGAYVIVVWWRGREVVRATW